MKIVLETVQMKDLAEEDSIGEGGMEPLSRINPLKQ